MIRHFFRKNIFSDRIRRYRLNIGIKTFQKIDFFSTIHFYFNTDFCSQFFEVGQFSFFGI